MYKVLLVDDEVLTRDAISQNIRWEEAGYHLIGTAENGHEAINFIEQEQPDLVLTDICMPVMDGIALSAEIYKHYPSIKVIIISGYDEFEYAKQAIRYEVSNYILKPITSFELMDELEKVKIKLDQDKAQKFEFEHAQQEYSRNFATIRSHFLNQILVGSYIKNDLFLQLEKLKIRLHSDLQVVVMLDAVDTSLFWKQYPGAKSELIDFSVANVTEEIISKKENIIFFESKESKSILIFGQENEGDLFTYVQAVCKQISNSLYQCMGIKVCAMVGKPVQEVKDWFLSYQSVLDMRKQKIFLDDRTIIYESEINVQKENIRLSMNQQLDKLVLMIKMNQLEDITAICTNIFNKLKNAIMEKEQLLLMVQNLVLTVWIPLEEYLHNEDPDSDVDFMFQISKCKNINDLEHWFLDFCFGLSETIAGNREGSTQKYVSLALEYMGQNYMSFDMSLGMICDYLGVSTSYFSTFFKNATGETFTEALTRIRINKAKSLFESTDMKNYEVALSVGYQDPHYFSAIFKKHVKVTPSDFVKQMRRRNEISKATNKKSKSAN
jgi:two-component system response regulator YesN